MNDQTETVTINAEVPGSLRERARIQALRERRPVKALIREALERYLDEVEAKASA